MSAIQQSNRQTKAESTPDSETLHRLAVESGKYLDLSTGDPLPIEEILAQGGELWKVPEPSEGASEPASEPVGGEGDGTLQRFREWCEERAESDKTHSYTRQKADRRYGKAKDVDRHFVRNCNEFSTILITYCRQRDDKTVTEHAKNYYPRQVTRKRRRLLKRVGVYEEMAGISVLAPRSPDRVSSDNASTPLTTHAHDFLWLPSHVEPEAFAPLREVDDIDVHISVEHHVSAEVETPDSVKERGSGLDEKRGDTTAHPQELGANLPLLTCRFDARGAPGYIERWCAHLREGTDGSFSTQGVRRFRKLKTFEERAAEEKAHRRVKKAHSKAQTLTQSLEYHPLTPPQTHASPDSDDSTEGEGGSCSPECRGESDTNHSTESRFTFKHRVPYPNAPTDEKDNSDESRFTFHEYE